MNKIWWLLATLGLLLGGCAPKLIPRLNIELEDTPDHRALVQLVEQYRQAFENKDIPALVELTSPSFFETNGDRDPANDYNRDGISEHYEKMFVHVKKTQLNIRLRDVVVEEDQATVDFQYTARFLKALPAGEEWRMVDEINRMHMARENGAWKILSGI